MLISIGRKRLGKKCYIHDTPDGKCVTYASNPERYLSNLDINDAVIHDHDVTCKYPTATELRNERKIKCPKTT